MKKNICAITAILCLATSMQTKPINLSDIPATVSLGALTVATGAATYLFTAFTGGFTLRYIRIYRQNLPKDSWGHMSTILKFGGAAIIAGCLTYMSGKSFIKNGKRIFT